MQSFARVPLEGGGAILFEAAPELGGPVKAGRVAEAVRELPQTLQEALVPVRETARSCWSSYGRLVRTRSRWSSG